ncbi:hypothetical protein ASG97_20915 [Bacillus sp. Soil745]|uniref:hypothetical protein n=1 Tax=Peribacillus frigoritolerans TaxID=450367 RepID=UPI00070CD95E|nr:hypothetical protein [Peribacillus frigoritolerans]KRF59435.1 hypothetical protein ASG97_20915 [Bacillus sp. Soil745]MED3889593.1 hypothetical protein [Peribacillus frigoritolerans]PAW26243.1 hypothetical protein BKC07_25955 [Peribacillus simplex]
MIPLLRLGSKNVIALDLPTVGFVTFFAGGYHKIIANRLQANNKGNGTILSVTWVLAFNVKPQ